ncbi:MAG: short-chain dehydrogenase/reductase [Herminiimonas sp.]|nr:short-chain dehydrogenase/reductase [Herminiimonas sp.]
MGHEIAMTAGRELSGKVAFVTGAGRNIGRSIARSLARGGAQVMVGVHKSVDAAKETVALIEQDGGTAAWLAGDVTDPDAVHRMVAATVERFGRIDMLVNNAAVRTQSPFADITLAQWREILSITLDGAFICSQAVLPHLIAAGGGTIINIGGETGHAGAPVRAHVVTAKAGLAGFTKALAHDLAAHHINVNCVVPGNIATVREGADTRQHRKEPPLIGRTGLPEEVAAMVRMLCGPESRYITGQSIHVNGGALMI